MPTRIIREPRHLDALLGILGQLRLPITVTWRAGESRSDASNRLAQRWFSDVSRQMGDRTHEDVRAEAKLRFGVPILRRDDPAMDDSLRTAFDGLTYEESMRIMHKLDIPVTRLMTSKQMSEFMDVFHAHWSALGVYLTDPEAIKYEAEFGPMEGAA